MKEEGIARQLARWVALGALFLIPLTPLLVANSYFFPFITGKAFYFRILVEVAVSAWAVLACLDRAYRPRFSWIGAAAIAFVVWMFVADAFAPNAAKAFWSNFERMEGWILLVHLLGFFYAASSVLRVEKKWRAWFLTSLGVSVVISGYALLQLNGTLAIHQGSTRIDATLGNSAYLAIYFLFNIFIALWLALTEKYSWLKWSLMVLAAVEAVLLFFTETRGTVIGLVLSFALAALLAAVTAGAHVRRFAAGAFVLILVLAGGFYLARDSAFIQGNHVLQRVASVSLSDGQTRFTIWSMAFKGTLERPLTGWGQEGFNYIFNKYYEPSLYGQEPWFDRAHNAFIDWLTAGGIPAFLLYLSLFGSAIVLLWRSTELSRPERILLTAALVGYAVHNMFVFDNLYSYIYFFAILAVIHSQTSRPIERIEKIAELSPSEGVTYALPVATVVAVGLVWFVNILGMNASSGLITAMSPFKSGLSGNLTAFEALAAHPSFAGQEIREQIISFAGSVVQSAQAKNEEKQRAVLLAITEMQKQVAAYPRDAREHMQLSYAYRLAGDNESALKELQAAITLSPKKIAFLIERGSLEWELGDTAAARADFDAAYALAPSVPSVADYAAAGAIVAGDRAAANKILMAVHGTTAVDSDILSIAYYRAKDWESLVALWKQRADKPDATVQTLFGLASVYYLIGDKAEAIATIKDAVARFPDSAAAGADALKQIQEGK